MRIYFDKNDEELLTEEEAFARVDNLMNSDFCGYDPVIDKLANLDMEQIWDMLTIDVQESLIDCCRNEILEERFIVREFDD